LTSWDDWADMCYRYKKRWITYLTRLYGASFIREYGFPARVMCRTPEQLYNQIGYHCRVRNLDAFISVNAYRAEKMDVARRDGVSPDYNTCIYTRLFLDFDGNTDKGLTLENAHNDALIVMDTLRSENAKMELRFSGSKGFAVELLFPCDVGIERIKQLIARAQRPSLDRVTNHAQIYRIPYTLHPKTLLQCIPISVFWSLDRILDEARRYKPPPVLMPGRCQNADKNQ